MGPATSRIRPKMPDPIVLDWRFATGNRLVVEEPGDALIRWRWSAHG